MHCATNRNPNLEPENPNEVASPRKDAVASEKIIVPFLRATIRFAAVGLDTNRPYAPTRQARSNSLGAKSRIDPFRKTLASITAYLIGPSTLSTWSTAASTASASVTSAGTGNSPDPCFTRMSSSGPADRASIPALKPSAISLSAVSFPNPGPKPAMNAEPNDSVISITFLPTGSLAKCVHLQM